ncbi:anhydro-N-acetylmuramic acid kinase [Psychrobacter ciconiae]|uniref:anhydro-N-acetylmuramic acid kinase n=1 Tax=Psychrobacter ciconiae TaxID=1553449 RepID=UPI00387A44AC
MNLCSDEIATVLPEFDSDLSASLFESFDDGLYIGMMSGTSLDGMDAVICQFNSGSGKNIRNDKPLTLIATISQDFPARLREILLALTLPNGTQSLTAQENEPNHASELDWFGLASLRYSEFASEVVNKLLEQANISAEDILAIGCHGQTVRHRPNFGFSLQLIDASIIAERTKISVVSDFRRRDLAVGGQGAPLVPAFHDALFAQKDKLQILLNLGGIANITVLPPNGDVVGFDTGPANILIDAWVQKHLGKSYDKDGAWAKSGQIIEPLLEQLLTQPFFAKTFPKSTGREEFNLDWLEDEISRFVKNNAAEDNSEPFSPADIQATLVELTVKSSSAQILPFIEKHPDNQAFIYVCGGGALNGYLLQRLQANLPNCEVLTTEALGLAPTWVEAVAFAWLAKQTMMGETSNLPAVTGADKKVVLGQVCFA